MLCIINVLIFFFIRSRLTIVHLQEKELPELRNRLQTINREIEKLNSDIEEQETLLRTLMSEEETSKACLQDISLMNRYLVAYCAGFFLWQLVSFHHAIHIHLPSFFFLEILIKSHYFINALQRYILHETISAIDPTFPTLSWCFSFPRWILKRLTGKLPSMLPNCRG